MKDGLPAILELTGRLDRLMDGIENIKERQETMAENITEIKKAVYHPDEGIYARIKVIEQWRIASNRVLWIVVTSLGGLITAAIWTKFLN